MDPTSLLRQEQGRLDQLVLHFPDARRIELKQVCESWAADFASKNGNADPSPLQQLQYYKQIVEGACPTMGVDPNAAGASFLTPEALNIIVQSQQQSGGGTPGGGGGANAWGGRTGGSEASAGWGGPGAEGEKGVVSDTQAQKWAGLGRTKSGDSGAGRRLDSMYGGQYVLDDLFFQFSTTKQW